MLRILIRPNVAATAARFRKASAWRRLSKVEIVSRKYLRSGDRARFSRENSEIQSPNAEEIQSPNGTMHFVIFVVCVLALSQWRRAAARPLGDRARFSCRGTHYVYFSNSQMHTPRHIAKRHGAAHAKMQGERRWRARTTTGSCTHAHTQTHTRTHTHTYVHTHAHVHTLTHAHAHERGDDSRRRGVRGCGPRVWVARAARVWAEAVCGEGVGGEGGEGVGGEGGEGGRRGWRTRRAAA